MEGFDLLISSFDVYNKKYFSWMYRNDIKHKIFEIYILNVIIFKVPIDIKMIKINQKRQNFEGKIIALK